MSCYLDYLEFLAENLAEDHQPPLVPAPPILLCTLTDSVKKDLAIDLPKAYLEFLEKANGFQYNGVFFFSCDQELNLPELLTENFYLRRLNPLFDEYLVLGQSTLWHYAYHAPSLKYRALQVEAAGHAYYEFEDFDDCLSSALEESLDLLEEEEFSREE